MGDIKMSILAKRAGKFSFMKPKGYPMELYKNVGTAGVLTDQPVKPNDATQDNVKDSLYVTSSDPGILGIPFIPAPGISRDPNSALNMSMFNEISEICEKGNFSYIGNIDASDLGSMFISEESAYLAYKVLVRTYTVFRDFQETNLYDVISYFKAMHFDYNDWMKNMPNVIYRIREMEKQLERLKLPKKFPTIDDHFELVGHIYKDRDLDKAAKIMYYPAGFWKYNPTVPNVQWVPLYTGDHDVTFAEFDSVVKDLLNHLIPDQGIADLNAYVRKAYGDENCYKLTDVDWSTEIQPKYDEDEIARLHHACFLNYSSVTDMDITQEISSNVDTYLKWDPTFTVENLSCNAKRILDIKSNDPNEDEVFTASKYMWSCKVITANGIGGTIKMGECSSIILCNPEITIFDLNMELHRVPVFTVFTPIATDTHSNPPLIYFGWIDRSPDPTYRYISAFNSMLLLSRLSCAPITLVTMVESNNAPEPMRNKLVVMNAFFVRYNWITIEDESLEKILRARIATSWAFDV